MPELLDGYADLARLREAEAQCALPREIVGDPFSPPQDVARLTKDAAVAAPARAA